MIDKASQLDILQRRFANLLQGYEVRLYDEYTDIDIIKRENNQTQAQVQAGEHTPLLVGVVQSLPSQLTPIANLESIAQSQILTFFVPNEGMGADGELTVEATEVIQALNNVCVGMAGVGGVDPNLGSYVLAPSLPVVGSENNMLGYWAVDVSITIGWQIMKNGVISNNIVLEIDGVNATWLDFTISRTRVPEAVNLANKQNLETHIIQQGLSINVALPLQNEGVGRQIFEDSLNGELNKKYTVKVYTDGNVVPLYQCKMVVTQVITHLSVGLIGSLSVEMSYAGE